MHCYQPSGLWEKVVLCGGRIRGGFCGSCFQENERSSVGLHLLYEYLAVEPKLLMYVSAVVRAVIRGIEMFQVEFLFRGLWYTIESSGPNLKSF
jgi:hypothetical protein